MGKQTTNDDSTKRAAQYLLRRGLATYAEVADLSGRSRQIVRHWAQDWPDARERRLLTLWKRAMERDSGKP